MRFEKPLRRGIRKSLPFASIVVAATDTLLYTLTTGRTFIVRKLHIVNHAVGAQVFVHLTNVGGAQLMPGWYVPNNTDLELTEEDITALEFTASLYARSSAAAAAPNEVQIAVEIEEFAV